MIFDSHIHLDRLPTERAVEIEIEAARKVGVSRFLVPAVDRASWSALTELAAEQPGVLLAFGLHPLAANEWDDACREELQAYLQRSGAVAVGEVGLDRFVDVPRADQEQAFREQVQVAVKVGLPLLIHCRRMPGRLLEILREEQAQQVGGIMHAFSGSYQTATAAIDLGFGLGFGGGITWPEAKKQIKLLRQLPDDAIVIETDAPDMAPHPHRGESNRPAWIELILRRVAELKGWGLDEAAAITYQNAARILKLEMDED